MVFAVTELLTGPLPASLKSFTEMVYLFPSSSPVIVLLVKLPVVVMLPSSSLEQPREVSLCHWTKKPVTTESLGTLPVMVTVVAVTVGVESMYGADGTVVGAKYQSTHTEQIDCLWGAHCKLKHLPV